MNARALGLLSLVAATTAFAAGPHVTQVLSSRQARLGEPLQLVVTVSHAPGERWELQVPEDLGAFSVLGRSATSRREGDQQVDVLTLSLAAYEPGKLLLPALTLHELTGGAVKPLERDAEVEIVSSLAKEDPRELRDVAPPRLIFALDPRKVVAGIAGALALCALGVLAVRAARRLWGRMFPPESEESRDRRLLAQLEDLDDEAFFDTLDGLLRRGLARWHGVAAPERTTAEIVNALRARPPDGVNVDALASALRESVLVRFAHRPTSADRRRAALEVTQHVFPVPTSKGSSPCTPSTFVTRCTWRCWG